MSKNEEIIHSFLNGLTAQDFGDEDLKICRNGSKLYSYGILIAQFIINKRGRIVLVVHCPNKPEEAVYNYGVLVEKAIELRDSETKIPVMEYTPEDNFPNDFRRHYETEIDKFNRIA